MTPIFLETGSHFICFPFGSCGVIAGSALLMDDHSNDDVAETQKRGGTGLTSNWIHKIIQKQ